LHFSDPLAGSDGAILECRERYAADPERFWKADQYNNPDNPGAHYATTGPEIWAQTGGAVTHFVASVGTSGTVMGTSRFLKEQSPAPAVIAVEPDDAFHGLEGMKHIASAIVPGIYDAARLDRTIYADTDAAYALTRRLALEEGILAGPSSGAAILGALQVAAETGPEGCVVTLACDGGTRYLSTRVFEA
ncbi:MAG: PLP-dependent cysteine synthase family protein, partial [Planctomycetota bacterium]